MTVATVDTFGRKPIQLMGFVCLTILFVVWGFAYKHLSGHAMLGLYVLVQFFFNFGKSCLYLVCQSYTDLELQDQMQPPSLSLENVSQLVTVPPLTVSPPPPGSWDPSSRKPPLHLSVPVAPLPSLLPHGQTMSCKSTPSSCSWAFSPLF